MAEPSYGFQGDGIIGGYAINTQLLPPPDVSYLASDSSTSFLAYSSMVLAFSGLDGGVYTLLSSWSSQAVASLSIRLHSGWIVGIPILLRVNAYDSMSSSAILYITPTENVLLVTPRYPAQYF